MRKISQEEYNSFNAEQKEVVKLLGIKVVKKFRKKNRVLTSCPPEYTARIEITCCYCGSITIKYLKMQKEGNHLKGIEIEKEEFEQSKKKKVIKESLITCRNCISYLNKKEKAEIIHMFLKLRRKTINR